MSKKNSWPHLLMALAALAICPIANATLKTLPGHVPAVVAHLTPVGLPSAFTRLDLALGLPLRNQPALDSLLHQLYDPASPNFHHYLTPEQYTGRFGPTEQDYQAVIDFARTNGLIVTHTHGNRLLLDVNGTVSDIEKAFHVTLHTYRHPTEARDFFAPDAEPSVAVELPVREISGLSDYARPMPMLRERPTSFAGAPAIGSGPHDGFIGKDFRNAYVPGSALDGSGQMVGLVQFSGYNTNDILAYEQQAGLPNVPLENVYIDNYGGQPQSGEDETCLDIEMAISLATNLSAVVVFEGPSSTPAYWIDVLDSMVSSNQIKQFSSSWGFSGNPSPTMDSIFQQMAAQGQSFFQASGDGDAWIDPIFEPSECPYLTSVGGTTLTMSGAGVAYQSEQVWNWGDIGTAWGPNGIINDYWGSGGGVSTNYPIPAWQTNANPMASFGSATQRNIPDVALIADNIYVTYDSGLSNIFGGTSCAAPLWAGFMALANQQGAAAGKPPVGFINPAVYELANESIYSSVFHDITTGNSTWPFSPHAYYAQPGYDLCTGVGTPAGTNLISALLNPDPLVVAGGFNAVALAGAFSISAQTCCFTNAGLVPLAWSLINTSAWLNVSSASGTLPPGAGTSVVVSLSSAASNLDAGTYTAGLWFTNATSGVGHVRYFTLLVSPSLVQNGGFETGDFTHWTLYGDTVIGIYIDNGVEDQSTPDHFLVAHSGYFGAFLGDSSLAILAQTLPTIPGQKYLLSFWLDNPSTGRNQFFEVNWNTNGTATNTIFSMPSPPVLIWTNFAYVLDATGTNTTLQFGAANQPNYFGLDDIGVTPIPAPSFVAVTNATNGLAFAWTTLANVGYVVQYKTNLLQASWLNLGGSIIAATNTLTLLDTNAFTLSPQRFYRISISP